MRLLPGRAALSLFYSSLVARRVGPWVCVAGTSFHTLVQILIPYSYLGDVMAVIIIGFVAVNGCCIWLLSSSLWLAGWLLLTRFRSV